jgi:hypothetical protein
MVEELVGMTESLTQLWTVRGEDEKVAAPHARVHET